MSESAGRLGHRPWQACGKLERLLRESMENVFHASALIRVADLVNPASLSSFPFVPQAHGHIRGTRAMDRDCGRCVMVTCRKHILEDGSAPKKSSSEHTASFHPYGTRSIKAGKSACRTTYRAAREQIGKIDRQRHVHRQYHRHFHNL